MIRNFLNILLQNGGLVTISNSSVKWYFGLRWKLFIIYFFVSFLPLIFFSMVSSQTIEAYFQTDKERGLLSHAESIAEMFLSESHLTDASYLEALREEIAIKIQSESYRALVLDDRGIVIIDSNGIEYRRTLLFPEVISALSGTPAANLHTGEDRVHATFPIFGNDEHIIGTVLLVSSFEDVRGLLVDIQQQLILITVVTSVLVTVLVFFVSQLIIDPLKNILKGVKKMSEGHLDVRLNVAGRDEFSEMATAFNKMSEKLEQVEMTRQEFVSNVSHELKTPLSSIKVLSDSITAQENVPIEMYQEFLQDISSEVDRMANIIDDLLTLVKLGQKEASLNIKKTDINKLTEDILKRLCPIAEQKNIELLYEDVRKVVVQADEMKISLAVSNLVENAIKYTKDGGMVKVIVDADHRDAFITVQDTGIGIQEDEHGKIFTRFYRVDKTRDRETGGTGLGLAITHSTILLHHGSIRLASKENLGSTFTVRLPINFTIQ